MENLTDLPPLALIALGVTLALIFGVRFLGLFAGANAGPAAKASGAQVAAVIVDPTALNNATDALRGLSDEIEALRQELRELGREIARRN